MNSNQIKALIRAGDDIRKPVGDGLYFRIKSGTPSWFVRYSYAGKRKTITLPEAFPHCSLADAKNLAAAIRSKVKVGIDPQLERQRERKGSIQAVDDLFKDWFERSVRKQVKHPGNDERIYRLHIKARLGKFSVKDIEPMDVRNLLDDLRKTGNKTTATRSLSVLKRMFNHAIKIGLIIHNPALPFTQSDTGYDSAPRKRILSLDEIYVCFETFRAHNDIITRENYLAFGLLLFLGCRKGELISAKWDDIDFDEQHWRVSENKSNRPITVPLPNQVIPWFEELRVRAAGSEYVFPARRRSKRRGYISDDTLNHALAKLFGLKVDSNKAPYPNILGAQGVDAFVVHDLRRTFRSLLAKLGVPDQIAERCLNHSLQGVLKVYNQYDYLDERRDALTRLADMLAPIINGGENEQAR